MKFETWFLECIHGFTKSSWLSPHWILLLGNAICIPKESVEESCSKAISQANIFCRVRYSCTSATLWINSDCRFETLYLDRLFRHTSEENRLVWCSRQTRLPSRHRMPLAIRHHKNRFVGFEHYGSHGEESCRVNQLRTEADGTALEDPVRYQQENMK